MSTAPLTTDEILESIRVSGHQKAKVAITDIDGILRGKYIHIDKLISALEKGFGFCNVVFGWDVGDICYDNAQYTGWHTGYPDAEVRLDLNTYRQVPWDNNVPFLLGDFQGPAGTPLGVCPRQLLKGVIARARDLDFEPMFGVEYEFFNFDETPQSLHEKHFHDMRTLEPGMFGYSLLRSGLNREYMNAIADDLAAFGVPLEGLHTETGPGVYEAAILYSDALEAADRGALFKSGVKEIAYRYQIVATFMAKWDMTLPGCSGHLHQSLWNTDRTHNLFYKEGAEHSMSDTFRHYIAGQLHCMPEILPFFAPTINSYKRLVEGLWAPTRVTWGCDNRTTAVRVISGGEKATRTETRVTGSDINPYLAIAAALGSGLYGIQHKLELTDKPVEGNAYAVEDAVRLPGDLAAATDRLADSAIAREMFGAEFVDHFVQSRRWECRQFHNSVTSWELERYFEII